MVLSWTGACFPVKMEKLAVIERASAWKSAAFELAPLGADANTPWCNL